ncbi:unnamed protein product [Clavelina lepadiformis]|uniref:CUE domain-containing protein n=1 Tax=Clavelina lepadiformis TaxID=159417 RepID=A0ABP0FEV4_CLALP
MKKSMDKFIPVDEKEVTILNPSTDELEQRSALHPDLCQESLSGVMYKSITVVDGKIEQTYFDMLDSMTNDLHWLLSLNHAKFWCQVLNDISIHACLDSYLRNSPRYKQDDWPEDFREKHNIVHKLVFFTFLRMSTPKESAECFISKDVFAEILYDNFLFDIPRMMDICSLYGVPENRPLLEKMLDSIFQNQPQYFDDLTQAAKTVVKILDQIESKCCGVEDDMPTRIASGLSSPLLEMQEIHLRDIVLYLSDTLRTLKSFMVDIFPTAAKHFYEEGILDKLSLMYCGSLRQMRLALSDRKSALSADLYDELKAHVQKSRECLLNIVHDVVKICTFDPLLDAMGKNKKEQVEILASEYLHVVTSLLSDHGFIGDLNKKHKIRKDVETVAQACPQMSETQCFFIIQAFDEADRDSKSHHPASSQSGDKLLQNGIQQWRDEFSGQTQDHHSEVAHCSNTEPSQDVETASLISSVHDLFPDFGSGFITACLREFDFNPERVIQKILDGDLPQHLDKMDRTSNEIPSLQEPEVVQGTSLDPYLDHASTSQDHDFLSERRNIFDNDQFDVFGEKSDIDWSKVHQGKQNKSDMDHWKEDRDVDVEKLRNLYSKYGLVDEEDVNDYHLRDVAAPTYDDEYDDTYDDVAVGANDADSADELLPNQQSKVEQESTEERTTTNANRDRKNFCENPEIVRARHEARWQQRQEQPARRGGKSKQGGRPPPQHSGGDKPRNVDRKKEAHKYSRPSQNRKAMATKKASRGMFMGSG